MKTVVATILLLFLAGCANQKNRQAEEIRQGDLSRPYESVQIPVRKPLPAPATDEEPRAEIVAPPADVELASAASNNANQQNFTGIGAQIAKFAEVLQASLVRMEVAVTNSLNVRNELRAELKANAELRAEVKNHMSANADLRAELKAQATAIATLRTELNTTALGQAGLSNRIDQVSTSAGRDVNTTTQFSDGMERVMLKAIHVIYLIVGVCVGALGAQLAAFLKFGKYLFAMQERGEKRQDALNEKLLVKGAVK